MSVAMYAVIEARVGFSHTLSARWPNNAVTNGGRGTTATLQHCNSSSPSKTTREHAVNAGQFQCAGAEHLPLSRCVPHVHQAEHHCLAHIRPGVVEGRKQPRQQLAGAN